MLLDAIAEVDGHIRIPVNAMPGYLRLLVRIRGGLLSLRHRRGRRNLVLQVAMPPPSEPDGTLGARQHRE